MLLRIALGIALFETLLLAGVLSAWADRVKGGRLLAAFLLCIAVWISGNELPNWFGLGVEPLALHLLATAPLTSAVFFHFCVVFCRAPVSVNWVRASYLLGAGAALTSQVLLPAHFVDHPFVGRLAWAEPAAWITSVSWMVLGIAGLAVLLRAVLRARPPSRAQIAAVTASCLWGVVCLCGYGIALLGWPLYPFPLLALPFYPLILVYGILRYDVFVANAWAGRALVWTLLLSLGAVIVGFMPLLFPLESRWLSGLVVAASCLALNGPVRRFVHRLVYPGGEVDAQDIGSWRRALSASEDFASLARNAQSLLGNRLAMPLRVQVDEGAIADRPGTDVVGLPMLSVWRQEGRWTSALAGWQAASPGQRHVAELFGTVLEDAALRVEQLQQLAERERERQLQARLAELGALAASVAHDIRNPLNIIAMAATSAPSDTRSEINSQVARIAHLARDLLDYAKPWTAQLERFDIRALVDRLATVDSGVRLTDRWPANLWVELDARRIEQALTNLLENARGAAGSCTLDVEQEPGTLRLHVCDDGPGVPEDLRERLFEPFASRSRGGTGLGLAIVARIAQAHRGTVALTDRPPWKTCFTLEVPA